MLAILVILVITCCACCYICYTCYACYTCLLLLILVFIIAHPSVYHIITRTASELSIGPHPGRSSSRCLFILAYSCLLILVDSCLFLFILVYSCLFLLIYSCWLSSWFLFILVDSCWFLLILVYSCWLLFFGVILFILFILFILGNLVYNPLVPSLALLTQQANLMNLRTKHWLKRRLASRRLWTKCSKRSSMVLNAHSMFCACFFLLPLLFIWRLKLLRRFARASFWWPGL